MTYKKSSLYTLVSIFFFFGFVAASNNILIPTFKSYFGLTQLRAQLVDFAFYVAYFVGSLIYLVYSAKNGDFLNKIGYKKGLILGLSMSCVGALFFVPACIFTSYYMFLVALFIIAFGFSLQQIVLNPFLLAMGNPDTGSHRINIAGSFNSFGTMIAPLILSYVLFKDIHHTSELKDLNSLIPVALILFGFFLLAILVVHFSTLPAIKQGEPIVTDFNIKNYPELILGIIAIFIYVGVEVTIGSNMGELLKNEYQIPENNISLWVSLYWGSLMIGRWAGSTEVFFEQSSFKKYIKFVAPLIAFAVIYLVNWVKGNQVSEIHVYLPFVLLASIVYTFSGYKASNNLLISSIIGGLLCLIGLLYKSPYSLILFISGGLYLSIMWPAIFEIATKRLGKYTNIGSSLLVMMIFGGALIPLFQGYLSDQIGIFKSYWVPFFGFCYLAFYGYYAKSKSI